jgi:hypothetical protein
MFTNRLGTDAILRISRFRKNSQDVSNLLERARSTYSQFEEDSEESYKVWPVMENLIGYGSALEEGNVEKSEQYLNRIQEEVGYLDSEIAKAAEQVEMMRDFAETAKRVIQGKE